MSNRRAFTLIELILVIAIITLIASVVFVAVNPSKRIGQANNTSRWQDLKALAEALELYVADAGQLPTNSTIGLGDKMVLCNSRTTLSCDGQDRGCILAEDSNFWGKYIGDIPVDPLKNGVTDTGYYITRSEGGMLSLGACDSYSDDEILVYSNTPLPDFSISCAGWYYAGYCWYMGAFDDSCDVTCASHGSCLAEDWNDDTSCTIGYHFVPGASSCKGVLSSSEMPGYDSGGTLNYRADSTSQDCGNRDSIIRRFCACEN
ncbi:MAG: prepilin-type N-terminal cleavage/methylation domain-containing protein [Candidatus Komeilibacteria bacterium]|jgi:prepilin-type N-terminal cleavage/methylation domain-containing protein|nr:prepilin-type N-terminal cleavage/methylation domain-containing protein [Candidatus Komeilibacteria bacterium]MBT4447117.1 prepilin-type N-terminal cleavage/methylation domain-containing protein [Candidatus Komeilibacteria bacterium]